MVIIETIAHKIADRISLQLGYDEDKKSVITYGLIGLLQIVFILMIIIIIGIFFDFLYESIVIYVGVGFIRKSTGGAHSRSMNGCNIVSVLSIVIMSALSRYIFNFPLNQWSNFGITILVFFVCLIVFYLKVPMDNPNKPIVRPEKIKRLRRQSFIKLGMLLLISTVFILLATSYSRFYSITTSIRMIMFWLLLTLSRPGIWILSKFDSCIDHMIRKSNV